MPRALDYTKFAIRNLLRHFSRGSKRKTAIGVAVPQTNRTPQFTQGKSPRLSKKLRIRHHPFSRIFPGLTLTFETRFECFLVAQRIGVEWLQKFQEPRPSPPWRSQREKRPRQAKPEAAERRRQPFFGPHQPAVKREKAAVIAQFSNIGRAAHHCDRAHSLRQRPRQSVSVGRAAGNPEHAKSFQIQKI